MTEMTYGAWIMLVVGTLIPLGGLSVCIGIALRHQKKCSQE